MKPRDRRSLSTAPWSAGTALLACVLALVLSSARAGPIVDASKSWYPLGTVWNGQAAVDWRPFRRGANAPQYGDMTAGGVGGVTYDFTPNNAAGFSIGAADQATEIARAFSQWDALADSSGQPAKVRVQFQAGAAANAFPIGWANPVDAAGNSTATAAGWTTIARTATGRSAPTGISFLSGAVDANGRTYAWRSDHHYATGGAVARQPDLYTVAVHEISHMVGLDHPAGYQRPPSANVWAPMADRVPLWNPYLVPNTDAHFQPGFDTYFDPRGASGLAHGWGAGDLTGISTLYSTPLVNWARSDLGSAGLHDYRFAFANASVPTSDYVIAGLEIAAENYTEFTIGYGRPGDWLAAVRNADCISGAGRCVQLRLKPEARIAPGSGISQRVTILTDEELLNASWRVFWELPNARPSFNASGTTPDEEYGASDTGGTIRPWLDWDIAQGFVTPLADVTRVSEPGTLALVAALLPALWLGRIRRRDRPAG